MVGGDARLFGEAAPVRLHRFLQPLEVLRHVGDALGADGAGVGGEAVLLQAAAGVPEVKFSGWTAKPHQRLISDVLSRALHGAADTTGM